MPLGSFGTGFHTLGHRFRFGGYGRVPWNAGFSDTLGMTMPAQGRSFALLSLFVGVLHLGSWTVFAFIHVWYVRFLRAGVMLLPP